MNSSSNKTNRASPPRALNTLRSVFARTLRLHPHREKEKEKVVTLVLVLEAAAGAREGGKGDSSKRLGVVTPAFPWSYLDNQRGYGSAETTETSA